MKHAKQRLMPVLIITVKYMDNMKNLVSSIYSSTKTVALFVGKKIVKMSESSYQSRIAEVRLRAQCEY